MATIHRLNAGWTLTDGILPPIALDHPMPVYPALLRAGYVPDARQGLNLTAAEWLYSRTFTYALSFDLPPMQDFERIELRFDHLYGSCTLTVNGCEIAPFQSGCFDITAAARPSGNELTVVVAPEAPVRPFEGDPLPARGIAGGVYLKGANRVTVRDCAFSAGEALKCILDMDAHISGKFLFTCLVSREGEALCEHSLHRRLIAARQSLELSFPLPESASGAYEVRLTIEHNGLLCDTLRGSVQVAPRGAVRSICHIRSDARAESDAPLLALLPALREAGFDGVSFNDGALSSRPVLTRLFELGLTRVEYDPDAPRFPSCLTGDALRKLAAPDKPWPPTSAAWRLRHSDAPDFAEIEAEWGALSGCDEIRCAAIVRLHQARRVFDQILSDRLAGRPVSLGCDADGFPRFGSCALTDADGTPRPALYAAQEALQPLLAVATLPGETLPCGELLHLPVTLLAAKPSPLPVTVSAAMYAPDGGTLSGVSFTALPEASKRVGELVCQLPDGMNCALLRVSVERPDFEPVIHDTWIRCGNAPAALAKLPAAELVLEGDDVVCQSGLAVGAVTSHGVRCLMPGDRVSGYTGECANA
ncbi:MAG: hypothetical protein Q4E13_14130 [Clostridia bacterium]|nr:hypothetical protein [Clostridia bacterium]